MFEPHFLGPSLFRESGAYPKKARFVMVVGPRSCAIPSSQENDRRATTARMRVWDWGLPVFISPVPVAPPPSLLGLRLGKKMVERGNRNKGNRSRDTDLVASQNRVDLAFRSLGPWYRWVLQQRRFLQLQWSCRCNGLLFTAIQSLHETGVWGQSLLLLAFA